MTVAFKDIAFGYSSARVERAENPKLLLDGYFDLANASNRLLAGPDFLVLGYKGSGKSAISQHLALRAQSDPELFVKLTELGQFPFDDFASIAGASTDARAQYPLAWMLLLLVYFYDSFASDASLQQPDATFSEALAVLTKLGLVPAPILSHAVYVSSQSQLTLGVKGFLGLGSSQTYGEATSHLPFFVERLRTAACNFCTTSTHLLVIDGLDDLLLASPVQYEILAALVTAVAALNDEFRIAGLTAKAIVLCRTDIYERLPGANTNKYRQDATVTLDWFHHLSDPRSSDLVQLINMKARVTDGMLGDVISEYLPATVNDKSIVRVLLDYTRHTPRDLIELFLHIQQVTKGDKPLVDNVIDGMRWYAVDYFLPEIKNELYGLIPDQDRERIFTLIEGSQSSPTTYRELDERAQNSKHLKGLDVETSLSSLFECSAIGNVFLRQKAPPRYIFRYRNRNASINFEQPIALHPALARALNVRIGRFNRLRRK